MVPGTTTLPVKAEGVDLARLFQIADHTSCPQRLALILHETRRRMGRPL
jgi:hypothetical protein